MSLARKTDPNFEPLKTERTNDVMPDELTPDIFDRENGKKLPNHPNYKG